MNSNWFKLVMKMTKVEYGKNLLLKGVPIIFNKGGAKLKIGENVTIKSSFLRCHLCFQPPAKPKSIVPY